MGNMIQGQDLQQQLAKPPLHQETRYKRSDNDSQPGCSYQIDGRQQNTDYNSKVNERLEWFIEYFVKEFEAKLHAYHQFLEGEVKKPGKFSDTFSGPMGKVFGGALGGLAGLLFGSPGSGATLGAKGGEEGGKKLLSILGNKKHKKKAINLRDLVERSQEDEGFRESLVEAGFDVFQSFEMQFMRVTTDQGPKKAIKQLARDATNRAINYMTREEDTSIIEGVILGESKKETVFSIKPGFDIEYEYQLNKKISWNTANLYRKVGLLVKQESGSSFYKKKSDSNNVKYGYRRLLMSESWDELKKEYELETDVKSKGVEFTGYNYILDEKDLKKKVKDILKKINLDDKNLEEERIKEILEEVRSDFIEGLNILKEQTLNNYVEHHEVLVNIVQNLKRLKIDEYLKKFEQYFKGIKRGQQQIEKSIEKGTEEIQAGIENVNQGIGNLEIGQNKLLQGINELKLIKTVATENIWFGAKEPVDLFTGREQELNDLHKKVHHSLEKITVISQMTSISGLGGIGKTELARKYIHTHCQDYDNNVIWVNAESEETLIESFRRLAQDKLKISTKNVDGNEKDIKSIVEEVYRFFTNRKSLFIFDNAEKNHILQKFLPLYSLSPKDNKPYVLITSREGKQLWEKWGIKKGITLGIFTREEAISFVKKSLEIDEEDKSQDDQIIELAVTTLQGFPLALQQAASHIIIESEKLEHKKNGKYTIHVYLKEYKEKKNELLNSEAFQSLDNDYAQTTFTTWKVTIDKIKDNEEYGQRALKILDVIAYFAPNDIPVEISFSRLEKDNEKLWKAVELLDQYSMIKLEQGKLDIHRLVQEVTRLSLKEQRKEEKILKEVLELFKKSSDITSDHAASAWNYASKYDKLINKFLKSTYDHSLDTPLHLLVKIGNYEAIKAILEINKSIINAEDNYGRTPLYEAAEKGHIEIVKLLVENNANINANKATSPVRASGWTVLHGAVYGGHTDIVQFLINKRVNIYAKDSMGKEPLYIALNEGHEEIIELLNGTNEMKLFAAASLGKLEEINNLLRDKSEEEKRRMTNSTQPRKCGPLQVAAKEGYIEVVKVLVENGADINNSADDGGYTPLHMAASAGHQNVVEVLVEYAIQKNNKFDILEVSDKSGWTILHSAAKSGCTNILKYLIKKFEKNRSVEDLMNASDTKGTTLLQTAAFHNMLDTVKFLITENKNADINVVDIFGATPLFAASIQNNLDVVKYLLEQEEIRINCDLEKVLGMLDITPLHAAAVYDNLEMAKLLATRSRVNAGKESSLTPLHVAAFFNSSEVIKYLVDNDACTDSEVNFSNIARVLNFYKEDFNEGYGSEFINYIAKALDLFLKIPLVGGFVSSQFTPIMISTVLDHRNQLVHRDVDGKLVCSMVISRLISLLLSLPQIKKQFKIIKDYVQKKKEGKQKPPMGEGSIFYGITNIK